MNMNAAHGTFIVLAYAAAVIIIGALVAWIMLDHRALRRTLVDFERRGITRRSDERAKLPP